MPISIKFLFQKKLILIEVYLHYFYFIYVSLFLLKECFSFKVRYKNFLFQGNGY